MTPKLKAALSAFVVDYQEQVVRKADLAKEFIKNGSDPSWRLSEEFMDGVFHHARRAFTMANHVLLLKSVLRSK